MTVVLAIDLKDECNDYHHIDAFIVNEDSDLTKISQVLTSLNLTYEDRPFSFDVSELRPYIKEVINDPPSDGVIEIDDLCPGVLRQRRLWADRAFIRVKLFNLSMINTL